MSNQSSFSAPGTGDSFAPDRTWGTVFIVLYALMLAFFLAIIVLGASLLSFFSSAQPRPFNSPSGTNVPAFPSFFGPAFAAIAGLFILISLGAHIAGAVGIHKSRAWGFWATIVLSVLSLGSSGGGTCLTIIPLVYSILRLAGAYGPKPS